VAGRRDRERGKPLLDAYRPQSSLLTRHLAADGRCLV
jgi:hypothetical protein